MGTDQAAHGTGLEIVDTDGQPVATPVVGRAYTLRATIVNPGAAAAYLGTADFYVAQAAEFDALAATPGATRPALSYAGFVALPGTTVRVDCPTLWTPRTTVEATSSVLVHAYDPIFDPLTKPFDAFTDRHVGRRDPNRETFVSEPGDQAISSSSVIGPAALAYGHSGCPAVDAQGFCVGGLWAIIPGAHWIWVTQIETNLAGASASFSKNFWLPENAKDITGSIQVAADDAYVVSLGAPPNAVVVGSDGTMDVNTVETPPYAWQNPKTFSIKPGILVPGDNSLEVQAIAYRERNYPTVNPAGIIYRMDLTWS